MTPIRLAVLGSGNGSNFAAILRAIESGVLDAKVVLVASDNEGAGILALAREAGIPTCWTGSSFYRTRLEPELELVLADVIAEHSATLIVLAGYMRVVKAPLLDRFPRRIINIHPSLLPEFPGLEAWRQALEAGAVETGCTVHYVDAGVDTGPILAQARVPVEQGDTPESLHARIQAAEHRLLPEVLQSLAKGLPGETTPSGL